MPNHCYNKIIIYGDEASKIASELKSEDTVFDFSKILPEPNYEEVEVKPTFSKEDEKDDFRMPKWWDWRIQNWGTKWNSYDDHVEIVDDETVEYTGRSSNDLTGCVRGTSAPAYGRTYLNTTASSHNSGAKIFGSYIITKVSETATNDANSTQSYSNKFTISLVSNAASTETGGGFFAFAGPVNQRS